MRYFVLCILECCEERTHIKHLQTESEYDCT